MFKTFLSPPNYSIRVFVKRKRINRVGYGLESPVEYIFYGNEKPIQWTKRTLDGVDGNVKKKKVLRYLKQSHFEKTISYFLLVFCFFWSVRYWEVILTGIIQIGLELTVR